MIQSKHQKIIADYNIIVGYLPAAINAAIEDYARIASSDLPPDAGPLLEQADQQITDQILSYLRLDIDNLENFVDKNKLYKEFYSTLKSLITGAAPFEQLSGQKFMMLNKGQVPRNDYYDISFEQQNEFESYIECSITQKKGADTRFISLRVFYHRHEAEPISVNINYDGNVSQFDVYSIDFSSSKKDSNISMDKTAKEICNNHFNELIEDIKSLDLKFYPSGTMGRMIYQLSLTKK